MRILIVTDAWLPQTNGVVRTLQAVTENLEAMGHHVLVLGPDPTRRATISLPFYSEIAFEFLARARLEKNIDSFDPETIHIATEGPLGWTMRKICLRRGLQFTTAYHTRFPQYFSRGGPSAFRALRAEITYALLRWFHSPSAAVMVTTELVENDLRAHGFKNLARWSLGVDTKLFRPCGKDFAAYRKIKRPILLYVGRVSAEKNLAAFLTLSTTGTKVVVGAGPDLKSLIARFPDVIFMGKQVGQALAEAFSGADVFVFPSKSETFGLVLLEACAAGLRIAAYPAPGPKDIFASEQAAAFVALDHDLQKAVDRALALPTDPEPPRSFAERYSWQTATEQFVANLCSL